MSISVVIPVLITNNKQLQMTVKCIQLARAKTKLPFELVIVETESQHLIDYADTYIYESKRVNPAHSHNLGWKIATGDYVGLLTNDVYVDDNWLECLIEPFNKFADCGATTLATTQFQHQQQNLIEEGNWWSIMMSSRKIFDEVGYYDEQYFAAFEDTDLLLRIYLAGYKMYRNFNCVVEHLVGATLYREGDHNEKYLAGRVLFNQKWKDCKHPLFERTR